MLLGYPIEVFTDHLNLVHETTIKASDRVLRWLWTSEEFGVTTTHIKGEKNVVADALSRLDLPEVEEPQYCEVTNAEILLAEEDEEFPLSLEVIYKHQQDCRETRYLIKEPGFNKKTVKKYPPYTLRKVN